MDRDRPVQTEEERGQQRPLLGATEIDNPVAHRQLDRAEEPEVHPLAFEFPHGRPSRRSVPCTWAGPKVPLYGLQESDKVRASGLRMLDVTLGARRNTMSDTILTAARTALADASSRTERLVESLPDLTALLADPVWTVREAAVHLVTVGLRYSGMIHGERNQYPSLAPTDCSRLNAELIADIPTADPSKVAVLIHDATERLLEASARGDDTQSVPFHCGSRITLPELVAIAAAEHLVHGYDIALAVGRPWPIPRDQAALALFGYG